MAMETIRASGVPDASDGWGAVRSTGRVEERRARRACRACWLGVVRRPAHGGHGGDGAGKPNRDSTPVFCQRWAGGRCDPRTHLPNLFIARLRLNRILSKLSQFMIEWLYRRVSLKPSWMTCRRNEAVGTGLGGRLKGECALRHRYHGAKTRCR